jgi:methyl-accepting chemotaxis protein
MRIKDMSVRTKVIGALLCVLVATIGLGTFAMVRLSDLNARAADIRDNWMLGISYLSRYEYAETRMRIYDVSTIFATRDADREMIRSNKAKLEETAREYWDKYSKTATSPEERALASAILQQEKSYYAAVAELDNILKTKGPAAAADYSLGPMRLNFSEFAKAIETDIKYNMERGNQSAAAGAQTYGEAKLWILAAMGLSVLICLGVGYLLITGVSSPLGRMTGAMSELAAGHLNVNVPHSDQNDEIGKLAEAMTAFKNELAAAERSKAEQTEVIVSSIGTGIDQLAKGDLTHRVTAELTGPFAKLKGNFNAAMERLQDTLSGVLTATSGLTGGAGEISTAADDLSRRTEQQAASLEETAAALEEITATVKKTAVNAKDARQSVESAKDAAERGGQIVGTAIQAMDAIAQSSRQITDIIGVIDEIAFQTNLLALNAGVEAARAGDAGKGFAVVASEVRALAQRSSEAAKQIKSLISASGEHVGAGVKLVGESGAALRQIVDQVQHINALVTEMAQAAEQQSTGIEQVNAAVSQMDQVTQQNAAMVEESTAASRNLAAETRSLQDMVAFFDVGKAAAPVSAARPAPTARPATAVRPASRAKSPARVAVNAAPAVPASDDGWTEF